jgi:hypothetical protein
MPTFKIIWTSYNTPFPDILTEENYSALKYLDDKKKYAMSGRYFKTFYLSYIIVLTGLAFIVLEYFDKIKHDGLLEGIEVIFVLVGGYALIYLVLSSFSYLSDYYNHKEYLKNLERNINASTSYMDFCMKMSKTDKRYVMHIQRISNVEQ